MTLDASPPTDPKEGDEADAEHRDVGSADDSACQDEAVVAIGAQHARRHTSLPGIERPVVGDVEACVERLLGSQIAATGRGR